MASLSWLHAPGDRTTRGLPSLEDNKKDSRADAIAPQIRIICCPMFQPELPGLGRSPPAREERGLVQGGAAARLSALLREQQRLLDRVSLTRKQLEALRNELQAL